MHNLLSILTWPFRFAWWLLLNISRIAFGKEDDYWVLCGFAVLFGILGVVAFPWFDTFLTFILGTNLYTEAWRMVVFALFLVPLTLITARLYALLNEEKVFDYWDQPPPAIHIGAIGAGQARPPVFNLGGYRISEKAMFENMICTGGIGSGKTAAFIYPITDQLLREYNTKRNRPNCGGLYLEVKGTTLDTFITLMRRNGRDPEKDLYVINPDDPFSYHYNIVTANLTHLQIANRLRSILNNLGGGGGDSFWLDSAEKVVANAILLLRLTSKMEPNVPPNLAQVGQIIADKETLAKRIEFAKTLSISERIEPSMTEQQKIEFNDRHKNIREANLYFQKQWIPMAEATKTGIIAAISNQLLRGFTDPKLQRIFCSETDFNMFDIVNEGKFVVLQAPGWGLTALMIGAALKLDFQQCMKDRLHRTGVNMERVAIFICDEYQAYATLAGASGSQEGDEGFLAVSRESRVINVVATQSFTSLTATVRHSDPVRVLLNNLHVKICLRTSDKPTAEHVSELCGETEIERLTSRQRGDWITDRRGGSKTYSRERQQRFKPQDFFSLQVKVGRNAASSYSEAIIYNEGAMAGESSFAKVRLTPIWLDRDTVTKNKEYWLKHREVLSRRQRQEAERAAPATILQPPTTPIVFPSTSAPADAGGPVQVQKPGMAGDKENIDVPTDPQTSLENDFSDFEVIPEPPPDEPAPAITTPVKPFFMQAPAAAPKPITPIQPVPKEGDAEKNRQQMIRDWQCQNDQIKRTQPAPAEEKPSEFFERPQPTPETQRHTARIIRDAFPENPPNPDQNEITENKNLRKIPEEPTTKPTANRSRIQPSTPTLPASLVQEPTIKPPPSR